MCMSVMCVHACVVCGACSCVCGACMRVRYVHGVHAVHACVHAVCAVRVLCVCACAVRCVHACAVRACIHVFGHAGMWCACVSLCPGHIYSAEHHTLVYFSILQ